MKKNISHYGLLVSKIIAIIVAFSIVGFGMIIVSYTLPRWHIRNHISESARYYAYGSNWAHHITAAQGDVFTDALMLNAAGYESNNPVESAALVPRIIYGDPQKTINIVYGDEKADSRPEERNYSRYWHGYLIVLAPLLELFTPSELIYLNFTLQFILIITLLIVAYKKRGIKLTAAIAAFIYVLNPITVALSFQYSSVMYITIICMLIMLLFYDKLAVKNRFCYFFAITGCLMNYFDLLTFPLVSLGAPLVLKLYLDNKKITDKKSAINIAKDVIGLSMCWLLAYAGTWVLKWSIASLVTGQNLFTEAINSVVYRTGKAHGFFETSRENIKILLNLPTIACFICLAVVYGVLALKKKIALQKPNWNIVFYILVALAPFVWYLVLTEHSYMHKWFTYRELTISVFAVAAYLMSLTSKKKIANKKQSAKAKTRSRAKS